ncbi:MAG TPA: BrnT family toxin [Verrucomicrobiae bacterium]
MKVSPEFNSWDYDGFEWDSGNITKNNKHEVEPEEAEEIFLNEPLLVATDEKHSKSEMRWRALGKTAKRFLFVVFTVRGNLIRIISARSMNKKEKVIYEKETLRPGSKS